MHPRNRRVNWKIFYVGKGKSIRGNDYLKEARRDLDPFLWVAVCGTLSDELNALRRVGVTLKADFDYVIGVLSDRTCNFTSVFIVVVWPFGHGVLLWSAC